MQETHLISDLNKWPIHVRISHRIMMYAESRKGLWLNQYSIEEIILEELKKDENSR